MDHFRIPNLEIFPERRYIRLRVILNEIEAYYAILCSDVDRMLVQVRLPHALPQWECNFQHGGVWKIVGWMKFQPGAPLVLQQGLTLLAVLLGDSVQPYLRTGVAWRLPSDLENRPRSNCLEATVVERFLVWYWVHWGPLVAGKTVPSVKEPGKMPQVAPLDRPTTAPVYAVPAGMPMRCVVPSCCTRGINQLLTQTVGKIIAISAETHANCGALARKASQNTGKNQVFPEAYIV